MWSECEQNELSFMKDLCDDPATPYFIPADA